ncbi:MAG: asparagine synthase (glutamine-hydrolyzing) [Planctomycetota bacterium]|jgi:asparagine synthase (glutamine-hydrolysing)
MCGIVGYVNLDASRPADPEVVRSMSRAIVHRGPDDEGFYIDGAVALGMRRLSIIDLETGHQPISNEDGSVWVVFNGEIYNYLELRDELTSRGHRFRTASDTEVLVHLYEELGDAFVTRINAMAAIALWDGRRRRLLLARDRLGKKPLHYVRTGEALVFGSELKAVIRHPAVRPSLDPTSVASYLVHEYVPCPRTVYSNVSKLRPAHLAVFERGSLHERPYWDLPVAPRERPGQRRGVEEEIREVLYESVKARLMSDVPLGVFLSGGIDSTSIVACMARAAPAGVHTFSVAFEEPSFDESTHFRRVASHFGTRHEEQVLTPDALLEILPELSAQVDEPLADASILPTFLLSRFTRGYVTVALGGDGGDELLAGYPTYPAHRLAGLYEGLPQALRVGVIEPVIRRLPVSRANISFDFKAKRFVRGTGHPPEIRNQLWLGAFAGEQALSTLSPDLRREVAGADLFEEERRYMSEAPATDLLGKLQYVDLKMYLQDCILVKVDRASMACSLEVRAPLLDYRFVELIARLPTSWKLRGLTTKYIFKRAMRSWLPPGIASRSKKGFGIPVAEWLRGPLKTLMLDLLAHDRLKRQGLLDPAAVGGLVEDHLSGRHDNRKQIWTLLMLQLWHEHWGRAGAREAVVA